MRDIANMTEEKKIEILLHALSQRYSSIEIIRERVQNVCIWTLGLFITASGWLLQSERDLDTHEKLLFSGMIVISILTLRIYYLSDLEKGFKTQQKIQAKIESILGLCKEGIYADDSIYPASFLDSGSKDGKGKFFAHNYLLIYVGTTFLLIAIWLL